MDPLSALGLASNVIQFADFGIKLFDASREIYRKGSSDQNFDIDTICKDLDKFASDLSSGTAEKDLDIREFQDLSEKCRALVHELLNVLQGLRIKQGNRKWESFTAALRSKWKDAKIKGTYARLKEYRDQVTARLVKLMSDKQSTVLQLLQTISDQQEFLHVKHTQDLVSMKDILFHELLTDKQNNDHLTSTILALKTAAEKQRHHAALTLSLHFEGLEARHANIAESYQETFEWIFDSTGKQHKTPPHYFPEWLRSKSGIFWIIGKAGSGKSTLMKYISNHRSTQSLLAEWAGSEPSLLTCSIYFWASGTTLQKSQEGLLQSLLYEVIRQDPSLVTVITDDRRNRTGNPVWYRAELLECVSRLKQRTNEKRLCVFIDGLDEYDGDQFELVNLLEDVSRSESIKFCLSSRPRNIFEEGFSKDPQRHLVVQHYTKNDISQYVSGKLNERPLFRSHCETDAGQNLINTIVERAQGVFLWVFLVIRSLAQGLANADSISDLERRLSEMPDDLEAFFTAMLDSIPAFYQEDSARMLLACIVAAEPLPIGVFNLLDGRYKFACMDLQSSDTLLKVDSPEDMRRRINARCTDLVEVSSPMLYDAGQTIIIKDRTSRYSKRSGDPIFHVVSVDQITFVHRTVREFLMTQKVYDNLLSRLTGDFDALHAIVCGYILLAKQINNQQYQFQLTTDHLFDGFMFYVRERESSQRVAHIELLESCQPVFFCSKPRTASDSIHIELAKAMARWGLTYSMTLYLRQAVTPLSQEFAKSILECALTQGRASLSQNLHSHYCVEPDLIAVLLGETSARQNTDTFKTFLAGLAFAGSVISHMEDIQERLQATLRHLILWGVDVETRLSQHDENVLRSGAIGTARAREANFHDPIRFPDVVRRAFSQARQREIFDLIEARRKPSGL